MECPYCKYDYIYDSTSECGTFYRISNDIMMERPTDRIWQNDKVPILGCPRCGGIFIEIN